MKHIFFQLFIVCLALSARAQETSKTQLPPVQTGGAVVRPAVAPTLPLKSGDNARQQKPAQPVVVPVKSSGGNAQQQAKLQQTAEAPVRKSDGAPATTAAAGNGAQDKATSKDNKPVVVLPSSLSLKEAKEQSKQ